MECGQFTYEDSVEERAGSPELSRALKASLARPQVFYSWSAAYPVAESRLDSVSNEVFQVGGDLWIEYDPQTDPLRLVQAQATLRDIESKRLTQVRKTKPTVAAKAKGRIHWIPGWSLALEKRGLTRRIPSTLLVRNGEVDLKASPDLDLKRLRASMMPPVKARAVLDPTALPKSR